MRVEEQHLRAVKHELRPGDRARCMIIARDVNPAIPSAHKRYFAGVVEYWVLKTSVRHHFVT